MGVGVGGGGVGGTMIIHHRHTSYTSGAEAGTCRQPVQPPKRHLPCHQPCLPLSMALVCGGGGTRIIHHRHTSYTSGAGAGTCRQPAQPPKRQAGLQYCKPPPASGLRQGGTRIIHHRQLPCHQPCLPPAWLEYAGGYQDHPPQAYILYIRR